MLVWSWNELWFQVIRARPATAFPAQAQQCPFPLGSPELDVTKGEAGGDLRALAKRAWVFTWRFRPAAVSAARPNPGLRTERPTAWIVGLSRFLKCPVFLPSPVHSPGCALGLELVFPADREVEPALPAQRQPELLHRPVAATASGRLLVQAQLLLQRYGRSMGTRDCVLTPKPQGTQSRERSSLAGWPFLSPRSG